MPSMSFDLGFISDWIFPKSRDVLKIYKSGDEDRQDGEQDAEDGTVASRQEDLSGGISSWIMPPSRSAGPVPEGDNSLQDTSSNDQVLNAFIGLPEEIKTNLANASETLQNRFSNVSSDISSKLTKIHSKLADDVSNAIASQSKNETKT